MLEILAFIVLGPLALLVVGSLLYVAVIGVFGMIAMLLDGLVRITGA